MSTMTPLKPTAQLLQAVMADLGRARQEELPLNNVDLKGRSYMPPKVDESLRYDRKVKQQLNNKWSVTIHDEESEQMRGLTNLNARPWASSGPLQSSTFDMPRLAPKPAPRLLTYDTPTPIQARARMPAAIQAAPITVPPAPAPVETKLRNVMLYHGNCQVSIHQGHVVVPDANFCVSASAQNDAAFFVLTAPGKPSVCIHVLNLESPAMYGTSCIVRTKPGKEDAVAEYTVTPHAPLTAERLAKVLENIQIALAEAVLPKRAPTTLPVTPSESQPVPDRKAMPAVKPVPVPISAPILPVPLPVQSKLSPIYHTTADSSPDLLPSRPQTELVEFTVKKQQGKPTVILNDIIDDITVIVRNAYCQVTGSSSIPMTSSTDQAGDFATAEWLKKGHLDSVAEDTRRGLLEIMRLLNALRLKPTPVREPLMSSQTMELFKALDRGLRTQGSSLSYSATELLQLKKDAIVPSGMKRHGLGNSMWARK